MLSPWIVLGLTLVPTAVQGSGNCLHEADETAEQAARRRSALTAVRMINTEQQGALGRSGEFPPLAEAAGITMPAGFRATLSRGQDRTSYLLSAKDTLDPCGFAYFSDDSGVIYEGRPLIRRP